MSQWLEPEQVVRNTPPEIPHYVQFIVTTIFGSACIFFIAVIPLFLISLVKDSFFSLIRLAILGAKNAFICFILILWSNILTARWLFWQVIELLGPPSAERQERQAVCWLVYPALFLLVAFSFFCYSYTNHLEGDWRSVKDVGIELNSQRAKDCNRHGQWVSRQVRESIASLGEGVHEWRQKTLSMVLGTVFCVSTTAFWLYTHLPHIPSAKRWIRSEWLPMPPSQFLLWFPPAPDWLNRCVERVVRDIGKKYDIQFRFSPSFDITDLDDTLTWSPESSLNSSSLGPSHIPEHNFLS